MPDSGSDFPRESAIADRTMELWKGAIELAPGGSLLTAILGWATPALSKRQVIWLETLAERLELLERVVQGFNAANAFQNEGFVTAFLQATQAAIRTHQEEKLDALRNMVLNSALPTNLPEDLRLTFIAYVDAISASHLRLLEYFADPVAYVLQKGLMDLAAVESLKAHEAPGYYWDVALFEQTFPELRHEPDFANGVLVDLFSRSLVEGDIEARPFYNPGGGVYAVVSAQGRRFLDFVRSPLSSHTQSGPGE